MSWHIEFINEKALTEVEKLPLDMKAHLLRIEDLLQEFGLETLKMPIARPLQHGLWELRLKGKSGIARSLYITVVEKRIVILRTFIKKTQQTPHTEIELALKRAKEIK